MNFDMECGSLLPLACSRFFDMCGVRVPPPAVSLWSAGACLTFLKYGVRELAPAFKA